MKVYIVFGDSIDDVSTVLGVYSTLEKAKVRDVEIAPEWSKKFEHHSIQEFEVDKPC
jgi:hypothetical protein